MVYKIAMSDGIGGFYLEEVAAKETLTIGAEAAFLFKSESGSWNVSHLETGMRVAEASTIKGAISLAEENIQKHPAKVSEAKIRMLNLGFSLPVNSY